MGQPLCQIVRIKRLFLPENWIGVLVDILLLLFPGKFYSQSDRLKRR
jgi:hypothetical protein